MLAGNRRNILKVQALKKGENIILTSDEEIKKYINDSINGKDMATVAYGKVNQRLSNDISKYSNNKITVEDNYLELVSSDIRHAYDEHHKAKETGDIDLSIEEFKNIPDYIESYDELVYAIKYKSGNTRVCISKKISNGRILIIETVSKSRGSLQFKNAIGVSEEKYIKEYINKYKRSRLNTRGSESSNISLRDSTTSNTTIPQKSSKSQDYSMQKSDKNSNHSYEINADAEKKAEALVDALSTLDVIIDEVKKSGIKDKTDDFQSLVKAKGTLSRKLNEVSPERYIKFVNDTTTPKEPKKIKKAHVKPKAKGDSDVNAEVIRAFEYPSDSEERQEILDKARENFGEAVVNEVLKKYLQLRDENDSELLNVNVSEETVRKLAECGIERPETYLEADKAIHNIDKAINKLRMKLDQLKDEHRDTSAIEGQIWNLKKARTNISEVLKASMLSASENFQEQKKRDVIIDITLYTIDKFLLIW